MHNELQNKFIAVLSKKVPVGLLMNALGHMAAGSLLVIQTPQK